MDMWIILWSIVLIVGLVLFLGLAIVVVFGGMRDITAMFKGIDARRLDQGKPEAGD